MKLHQCGRGTGGADSPLTEREMQVLKLVAKGHNNRDIATELRISEKTVKNHIGNILEKLHLHSQMQAVVWAVRERIFEQSRERETG